MTLAEVHVNWSVILIDRLGPDIFLALWMNPRGGGTPLYEVCAAPKGMVFEPFWSENGYRFWTFWSEIWYGFRGNVHESL